MLSEKHSPPSYVAVPAHWVGWSYGVIAEDGEGHRALLLPGIKGIDTVERQLFEVRRKAGIAQDAPVTLQRFEVLKFEE